MSSKPKPKLENQNKFRRRPQTFNEFFDKKVFTTYLNVYGIKDEEIENIPPSWYSDSNGAIYWIKWGVQCLQPIYPDLRRWILP